MPLQFATRLQNVETSAIRELFKLLGKPGIISFAGGFPDSVMFDVTGIQEAAERALTEDSGSALQYGVLAYLRRIAARPAYQAAMRKGDAGMPLLLT